MVTRSLHCNTPINDILSVCYRPIYSVITNHYLCDVSTVDVDGFHCLGQVVAAPNVGEYSFPKTLQTMTSEPVVCIQRCSLLQQVRLCFDFAGSHSNVITLVMVILHGQVNVSQGSHSNVITLVMVILHGQVNVSQGSHSNIITLVLVRSVLANWHKSFLAPGTRYHRTHFQLMNSVYSSGYSKKIEETLIVFFSLIFLTPPCRRSPLCIRMVYNICWRSFLRGHDPSDVRDLRVKVVVEIETP